LRLGITCRGVVDSTELAGGAQSKTPPRGRGGGWLHQTTSAQSVSRLRLRLVLCRPFRGHSRGCQSRIPGAAVAGRWGEALSVSRREAYPVLRLIQGHRPREDNQYQSTIWELPQLDRANLRAVSHAVSYAGVFLPPCFSHWCLSVTYAYQLLVHSAHRAETAGFGKLATGIRQLNVVQ